MSSVLPPSESSSTPFSASHDGVVLRTTSIELFLFGAVAVLIQFAIVICLCCLWCRRQPRARRHGNFCISAHFRHTLCCRETDDTGNNIVVVEIGTENAPTANSEPPPSYDEAVSMPRTTSGCVVLFCAGAESIYFRFTMTDDPKGLPPIFADLEMTGV